MKGFLKISPLNRSLVGEMVLFSSLPKDFNAMSEFDPLKPTGEKKEVIFKRQRASSFRTFLQSTLPFRRECLTSQ
jgi:hypothetical protein